MKKNKFLSALGAATAVGLTAVMFALNIAGTYLFYDTFSEKGVIKEASIFKEYDGYTENSSTETNAQLNKEGETLLIPLGSTFGIKLYTDGIIVTSLAEVYANNKSYWPAKDAGIEVGDYITAVNQMEIESNNHFSKLLADSINDKIILTIKRNDKSFDTELIPIYDGAVYRCGMWIRDSAAGIGTLTFADPQTNNFAGLGHGICDIDTKQLMSIKDGNPANITVCDIVKGEKNNPGKINGYFSDNKSLGELYENNDTGIYGKFDSLPAGDAIPLAKSSELEIGDAQILVTIDNKGPKLFTAKIESIANKKEQRTKNFVIRITDEKLLSTTGGIVQGMSGTPVLQNGKLVGAITHVFIDNPRQGYGIFAETMYINSQHAQ